MGDALNREYGALLGITGPILMERAFWWNSMAEMLEKEGFGQAALYLRSQAERAEEAVRSLAKAYENG